MLRDEKTSLPGALARVANWDSWEIVALRNAHTRASSTEPR